MSEIELNILSINQTGKHSSTIFAKQLVSQIYALNKDNEKLATLWRELSWLHHKLIMRCQNEQEQEFYLRFAIKEKWSVRELERQINSSYFKRVMLGYTKLAPVVRELPQDISHTFKDTYVLELLHLPDKNLLQAKWEEIINHLNVEDDEENKHQ